MTAHVHECRTYSNEAGIRAIVVAIRGESLCECELIDGLAVRG